MFPGGSRKRMDKEEEKKMKKRKWKKRIRVKGVKGLKGWIRSSSSSRLTKALQILFETLAKSGLGILYIYIYTIYQTLYTIKKKEQSLPLLFSYE